ncbi:EAL domain-containing protein [Achromobacter sp. NPDC058515]|uniref:EAL domain-containing protein n=1 Tax=Achromobacter sp. NPDC058515 TaxID=3346533 RepID=UPI0036486852
MTSSACYAPSPPINASDVDGMLQDSSQLHLEFQPQVNLWTGAIDSVEALARWRHPTIGNISPALFIPAVHRLRRQRELFERVVALAVCAARTLLDANVSVPIAINACADTLADPHSLAFLLEETSRQAVELSRLRVELTEESPVLDLPALNAALTELRRSGCEVALDDFGAGHANLSMLAGLTVDEVKLDRGLVWRMADSRVARESVRFVLSLGEQMGWRVVAEGVSSGAVLQMLRALGCRHGQGFLLGRPMPLQALMAQLGSRLASPFHPCRTIPTPALPALGCARPKVSPLRG